MTRTYEEKKQIPKDETMDVSLDSTGKRKSFKRLITRFAEKTSMQGVPYINNAKLRWAKAIWAVLLFIAIGMMVVHLWYLNNQFFKHPKLTKLSLGYDNLRFPQVTICNTNPIHKERFDKFQGAKSLKELMHDMRPDNLVPEQFDPDYDPTEEKQKEDEDEDEEKRPPENGGPDMTTPASCNSSKQCNETGNETMSMKNHTSTPKPEETTLEAGNGGPDTATEYPQKPSLKRRKRFIDQTKKLTASKYDPDFLDPDDDRDFNDDEFNGEVDHMTQLEETFRSLFMDLNREQRAYFGHNISDMLLSCTFEGRQCTDDMFRLTLTSEYGNCWTMESKQYKAKVSGPTGGLSLILYLESTEYFDGITNGYGMRLLVHEPGSFPFPSEEGHHISASTETSVGLRMIAIQREQEPYGNCDPDIAEAFVEQLKLTYTRRACHMVCEIDAMASTCGCFDDSTEELATRRNNKLKPCRSKIERTCRSAMRLKIARKQVDCNCPVPCSETAYEKSFSGRQWPSDSYAMVLLASICKTNQEICKTIRGNLDDRRAIKW